MKIPRDVSGVRAALKLAREKREKSPAADDKNKGGGDPAKRQLSSDIAEQRRKAKEASANLEAAQKLLAEKDEQLDKMKGDLEAVTKERDEFAPMAKLWKNYEHVERTKLLSTIPPELKKEVQEMPLNHLRLFASKNGASDDKGKSGEGKGGKDIDLDSLSKMDPKDINAHIDKVLKGEAKAPLMTESVV